MSGIYERVESMEKQLSEKELAGLAVHCKEHLEALEANPRSGTWERTVSWLCLETLERFRDTPSAV